MGGQNLEVGMTPRKIFHVVIVVVQITTRDCRKKKMYQKNGTTNDQKNDFMTATCDDNIIIVCDDPCDSITCQQTDWVVDSRASYHITLYREMFESYTCGDFRKVKMANHCMIEVVGEGDVVLVSDTG